MSASAIRRNGLLYERPTETDISGLVRLSRLG